MQIFNSFEENSFKYNNRKYVRSFILQKVGETHVSVYNAYDTKLQLMPSTHYMQVMVNGVTYGSQQALMDVLAPLLFATNGEATTTWGSIGGTLSSQIDLNNALLSKFNNPTGTTSQYIRGNGSLATLPAAAVWGNITGPLSAQTDLNTRLVGKLNISANTAFERLSELSDNYSPALFTRTGSIFRSNYLKWDEGLKKLTIQGTQAIWEASSEVTDGNMGIKTLSNSLESFKIFDNNGNFISTGIASGKKLTRVFTPLRLVNGVAYGETEFKTADCAGLTTTAIASLTIPTNSIVTFDIKNIAVFNVDKNSIIGDAQFTIKNDNGVLTDISRPELKYGRQYSYIKSTPNYVTSADTRFDINITGTTASISFFNTTSKQTNAHCEVKHNVALLPSV